MYHIAVRPRAHRREILRECQARHGLSIAVEQPSVEKLLKHHRHSAYRIDVCHDVAAARLEVRYVWCSTAHLVEVVDAQWDLGLVRDGQKVKHRISGAAKGEHGRNGVFQSLSRHDVPWLQPKLKAAIDGLPGVEGHLQIPWVVGGNGDGAG